MWVTLYSQMAEQSVGVEAHIDQVGQASPLQ